MCRGDEELFRYLMSWLADLVQRPGDKPGTAIALIGKQGCGKTILFEYMAEILGAHSFKASRSDHLTGRFNGHLQGVCLLGVEEGFWAGDKQADGVLKDLITSPHLTIEQKYADAYMQSNHVHLLATSNEDWVVPVGIGDRRWFVLRVADDVAYGKPGREKHWQPIIDALKDGSGPARLLHLLLNYEYDRSLLGRPPMTNAKAEQFTHSAEPHELFWLEVLRGEVEIGYAPNLDDLFGGEVSKKGVYQDFRSWCRDHNIKGRMVAESQFWKALRELCGGAITETRPNDDFGGRQRQVRLPEREVCQKAFAVAVGCSWEELSP